MLNNWFNNGLIDGLTWQSDFDNNWFSGVAINFFERAAQNRENFSTFDREFSPKPINFPLCGIRWLFSVDFNDSLREEGTGLQNLLFSTTFSIFSVKNIFSHFGGTCPLCPPPYATGLIAILIYYLASGLADWIEVCMYVYPFISLADMTQQAHKCKAK